MRITGWVPASRLGDVITHPGIRRIIVEGSAHRAPTSELAGDFLIGLRVRDASRAAELVAAGVADLT